MDSSVHSGTVRGGQGVHAGVVAAALALTLALAACGDPIVILGDQPGIMRVVVGVAEGLLPENLTPATQEALTQPQGLAVDGDGVLYVADHRASRILAVFSSGELETVVDHRACDGELCIDRPQGMDLDAAGGLIVADPTGNRVWRVDIASGSVSVVAGSGTQAPAPGLPADEVALEDPVGVAVDDDGTIYFSDQTEHRIWRVDRDGTIQPAAGTGESGFDGDGEEAVGAELFLPGGVGIARGVLYIADRANHRIRGVDLSTGIITTVAGNGVPAYSGDNGPPQEASLRFPDAVTITNDGGLLFISDTGNNVVRSVSLAARVIRTFAGTGDPAFTGSGLEAGETGLDGPAGLAVATQSLLFIADAGHGLVWRTPVGF